MTLEWSLSLPWRARSVVGTNEATACGSGKRVFMFTHHHSNRSSCLLLQPPHSKRAPNASHPQSNLQIPRSSAIPKGSLARLGLNPAHVWLLASFLFLHPAIWEILKSNVLQLGSPRSLPHHCSWMAAASTLEDSFSISNLLPVVPLKWNDQMSNRKWPLEATKLGERLAYGAIQNEIGTKTCWMQKTKTRNHKKAKRKRKGQA